MPTAPDRHPQNLGPSDDDECGGSNDRRLLLNRCPVCPEGGLDRLVEDGSDNIASGSENDCPQRQQFDPTAPTVMLSGETERMLEIPADRDHFRIAGQPHSAALAPGGHSQSNRADTSG
ncbi:MAG TPA: hypothetical protein VFM13_05130 [Gaiellaceae bacterium]|nr:hypothetical protein [Gaiellaceae bacterium]